MDKYDNTYFQQRALQDEAILSKVQEYVSEQKQLRAEAERLSLSDLVDYSQRYFSLLSQGHLRESEREILNKVEQFVTKSKSRYLKQEIYIYGQLVTGTITSIKPKEKTQFLLKLFEKATDDYSAQKIKDDSLVQLAEKHENNFFILAIISVLIIGGFIIFNLLQILGILN